MALRLYTICILACMSVALLPARSAAQGFALLGFPTPARIAEERVLRWPDYTPDAPLVLTYSIDEGFLADSGLSRAEIEATVRSALDRWTQASNGFVRFEPSPWDAVLNTDCTPRTVFVGPSTDIWIDWAIACNGDAACINDLPLPGWGAHIDFFSLPNDTSYCMGNRSWGTYDCNLGFISYWNNGDREITSADIVLNEKWIWTTDPAKATQASALDSEKSPLGYTAQTGDGGDPTMSRKSGVCDTCVLPDPSVPTGCENLVLAIDLETVLVHEIGHALGLDHPDETIANNSLLLDPLLFEEQPTGGGDPTAIMYSLYTGVKRELTPPDIGGLAYLYRPRWGDVDADGAITIADWFNAFRFVAGIAEADPYDVNILDYGRRNGLVELDEFSIFNGWVGGDVVYPFRVSIHTPPGLPLGATEITLRLEPRPIDIGLGGAVTVDLYVDNPNGRNVRGFDVELAYDPAVFSNPSVSYASLFPGGLDLPPDATTGGVVRFGQVATFEIPDTIEGLAASITFQIDLPAAVLADAFRFDVLNAIVPVTMPSIHNFGIDPCCPDETLIFLPALGFTNDYDVNGSGAIDLEDLYDFESTFVDHDVDQDGDRDQADRETLLRALRDDEQADSLTIPGG